MSIKGLNTNLVSVDWLQNEINNPNLILLDATINKVLTESSKRIPTARFFDIKKKFSDTSSPFPITLPSAEQFETEARQLGVNQDSIIVVYDDKGIYSSPRSWWLFKTFGFKNVAVLDGGFPEWQFKVHKVENYQNEFYPKGNFQAKFKSNLITDFSGINKFIKDSNALIIDARSPERFNCEVPEPREGLRRGTIPNSNNLHYQDLLNGNVMKSKKELLELFKPFVTNKKQMVFTCGSGITACILALGAHLCNYNNLVVYDGSWTEYGSLTE